MGIQEHLRFGELGAKHIGWTFRPQSSTEVFITAVSHDRHRTIITGVEVSNGLPNVVSIERSTLDQVTFSWGSRLATVEASWEGTSTEPETALSINLPPAHYVPRDGRLGARGGWQVERAEGQRMKLVRG